MTVDLKSALNDPHHLFQWSLDGIFSALGGTGLGSVLISAVIFLVFYLAGDGDFATPSVLLILMGGLMVPILPGGMSQVAVTMMLLGLVSGLLAVAERYFIRSY